MVGEMFMLRTFFVAAFLVSLVGCDTALDPSGKQSVGIWEREQTGGPTVIYDLLAQPLPEIPLPNDQATRLDPRSPTGRRLNVSFNAVTEYEKRARSEFVRMDGFGTYAPIMVSFDEALDLDDLYERHLDDDFRNDSAYLLNVDRDCERYGEEVALDMGRGRFPITMYNRTQLSLDPEAPDGYRMGDGNVLFEFDQLGTNRNMVFSQTNEDTNNNGLLDEGEDLDDDGTLDVANFRNVNACDETTPKACVSRCIDDETCFQNCLKVHDRCVADNLMTYYERETNTLILRPIWPLEQRCTYAVVLTKRLQDEQGRSIQSPFSGVNPREQTKDLEPLDELLPRYDLGLKDVAFTWTLTTGSMTADLEALRAGLYGHGPFAELEDEFPPTSLKWWSVGELTGEGEDDARLSLDGGCAAAAIALYWNIGMNEYEPNLCALEADASALAAVVGGKFKTPYLLHDRDGIATEKYPADNNEVWRIDPHNGEIEYGSDEVTFWCGIPHAAVDCPEGNPDSLPFCAPFPTVLYAHGYGSSRGEIISHMGRHAAMGQALCAIDGASHGLNAAKESMELAASFTLARPVYKLWGAESVVDLLIRGRDRDLDNDGVSDSGGDMWTADLFHTRDMVRQLTLEHIQFVRLLRSAETILPSGSMLGDIDGDGVLELGGPHTTIGMWGISLGGIISGIMAGADPGLDTASPNAGGAGLADIAIRSSQAGVPDAVISPLIGPLVAGCLPTDEHQQPLDADAEGEFDCMQKGEPVTKGDTLSVGFIANRISRTQVLPVGTIEGVRPGDRVVLENLVKGERAESVVNARGFFRLSVAADAIDAISRRPVIGLDGDSIGPVAAENTEALGDAIVLTIYKGRTDRVRGRLDRFGRDVTFLGTIYPKDAPLVVLQEGFGFQRNNPRLRRFFALAQSGIGPADPAIWGAHTFMEPLDTDYDPFGRRGGDTHVLVMPTAGDTQVPVNTGIAMGRVSGLFGSWKRDPENFGPEHGWRGLFAPNPEYGKSTDQFLIDTFAVEGDGRMQRFLDNPVNPNVLFDVDNVSEGLANFSCGDSDWSARIGENRCPAEVRGSFGECNSDADCGDEGALCRAGVCEVFFPLPKPDEVAGLRADIERPDGSFDSFRLPVLRPAGQHGIYNAQSFREFDADAYMVNFTARFLGTRGRRVDHVSGCDCSASRTPFITLDGEHRSPVMRGRRDAPCGESDLKICSPECAEAWGIRTPDESSCTSTP